MGYESKFFAVRKYNMLAEKYQDLSASETIATLDMCKMGCSDLVNQLLDLFSIETDFTIYMDDFDEDGNEKMMDVIEDKYGARICYCSDKEKAIEILKEIVKQEEYRRFKWLLKFFKMFRKDNDIYICHYGY